MGFTHLMAFNKSLPKLGNIFPYKKLEKISGSGVTLLNVCHNLSR